MKFEMPQKMVVKLSDDMICTNFIQNEFYPKFSICIVNNEHFSIIVRLTNRMIWKLHDCFLGLGEYLGKSGEEYSFEGKFANIEDGICKAVKFWKLIDD